ncbi:VENN motif pre-toxin domain-containing protein [Serratia liquefaciens]|uniref:VENN motif pre-toxin domain-containing protein n=1 Tax=Serratia liquefaciens TaxID=614 RepID=UPI0021C9399E|nr:VENN motif pre-toxin domain-containing protein [Serratia liquefaciens]
MAREIKARTQGNAAANLAAHAVAGALAALVSNNSALAGAVGAAGGELAAKIISEQYYGKDPSALTEAERKNVSALSQLAAGLAGGLLADSTGGAVTASQASKNAVENNSLSGDQARETVKQTANTLKDQVRDKLGEGTFSSIVNSVIGAAADTGDAVLGGADYGADAAMALTSCAMGDSYCSKALSDLSGKNQAAADTLKALMNSDTWSAVADTVKEAAQGNQFALEATGGMLAGIILPGKKLPDANVAIRIPDSRLGHIFRNAEGHIADTPANRQLILDVANDKKASLGSDRYGNDWSARMLPDGSQAWVQTRGGNVINAGVNNPPKTYSPEAGLSSLKPRGSKDGK